MNNHVLRILMSAGFAALVGTATAQSTGAADSQPPAVKGTTENAQTQQPQTQQPVTQPTEKMSGQENHQAQGTPNTGHSMGQPKPARHATKSRSADQASHGDTAYRDALKQCAQDQSQASRDQCLDNAIQQFHPNG